MRQRVILLFMLLFAAVAMQAQDLTVRSFGVAVGDLDARSSETRRTDRNGTPCALVKVQLPLQGAQFDGVVGDVQFRAGVYWVYMPDGGYQLKISHPQYHQLDLNLRTLWKGEERFYGVEQLTTYSLVINVPQTGPVPTDDGMRYLNLIVSPKTATVTVDGRLRKVDQSDGSVSLYLPQGTYTWEVAAEGYAPERGTATLAAQSYTKEVTLQSVMATVSISCPTPGAQIYVNNQLKGQAPWSGTLAADIYQIEARLDGYHSQRTTLTLAERSNRQIDLPALQAITGSLNVNFRPVQTEVYLDGKRLGTCPDVFRNIVVGTHRVELRKAGYQSETKQVTIAEGQTAQLNGQLQQLQTSTPATSSPATETGDALTITVGNVSFTMIRVEGGTFTMGATNEQGSDAYGDEKPAHSVTLSTYYMGETEVTQALWKAVMGSNPSIFTGDVNCPVEEVSWGDCQTFIRKLNQLTGKSFRLPTEAEWEYAARGGSKSRHYKYSGSNDVGSVAWYDSNSGGGTHPVKTKQPNELGLYDMSGNVFEWCSDFYGSYSSSAQTNPKGTATSSDRVNRGGSWNLSAWYCRVSFRYCSAPGDRYSTLGLRLAL